MPMVTVHCDCPNPDIRRSGSFWTIRWDNGLAVQLDADEWAALCEAIAATSPKTAHPIIIRDELQIRSDADRREALQ